MIFELTRYAMDQKMVDKLGPPFAFTLWVAARVLLVQGLHDGSIDPNIRYLIKILSEMGRNWGIARKYGELLEHVYSEYLHHAGYSIHIMADMRRCAFDLMFSISR